MDYPTVKITTNGPYEHVYVNGQEIKSCVAYDIHHEASELPKVTMTISAKKLEIEHGSADYMEKRDVNLCDLWYLKFKLWVLEKRHMWRRK